MRAWVAIGLLGVDLDGGRRLDFPSQRLELAA